MKLLRHFGVDVVYPKGQTCCGKPPNIAAMSVKQGTLLGASSRCLKATIPS